MLIEPVAYFRSPLPEKFGLPRQAGVAASLRGTVVMEPSFRAPEALRGLEGFDYLWLIWGFHLNKETASAGMTVRPPRLGGNERVGVFASRSPYRPNPLGLSSVRIERIDADAGEIHVLGADLADGTPIFDIKPYVEYTDSHTGVRSGFVDDRAWRPLKVVLPREACHKLEPAEIDALTELLVQDPRPPYQDDPERVYGLLFGDRNVRFRIADGILTVTAIE